MTQSNTVATKSFWSSLADVACFTLYVGVGTGVVAYEAVDKYVVPAVKEAAVYTAKKGEEFITEQVIPAYDQAMDRGHEYGKQVASKVTSSNNAAAFVACVDQLKSRVAAICADDKK